MPAAEPDAAFVKARRGEVGRTGRGKGMASRPPLNRRATRVAELPRPGIHPPRLRPFVRGRCWDPSRDSTALARASVAHFIALRIVEEDSPKTRSGTPENPHSRGCG